MSVSNNASRTQQDNCDSPNFFVATKHGWRRYEPPGDEAPFAVVIKGKLHLIYRATPDSEFFTAHPDSPRMTVRPSNPSDPWIFHVRIVTRDGGDIGADSADVYGALNHVGVGCGARN